MKLYGTCEKCFKKRFFVRKRQYQTRVIKEPITSKSELCKKCYKTIKQMINTI